MNTTKSWMFWIAGFLVLISQPAPVAGADDKLVFASVEGAYIQHISAAVLKEAYSRLDIQFEISWLPPKRALKLVSKGVLDGEISRVHTVGKLYPGLIQVEVPVNYVEGVVFSKKHPIKVDGWSSLGPYKIGINRGIVFAENGTRGKDVQRVNGFDALFLILHRERVDLVVSPRTVGMYQMIKQDLDGLIINEPPLTRLYQYHYLHKKHVALASRLETVLKDMQAKGEIEAIRSAYVQDLRNGIIRKDFHGSPDSDL